MPAERQTGPNGSGTFHYTPYTIGEHTVGHGEDGGTGDVPLRLPKWIELSRGGMVDVGGRRVGGGEPGDPSEAYSGLFSDWQLPPGLQSFLKDNPYDFRGGDPVDFTQFSGGGGGGGSGGGPPGDGMQNETGDEVPQPAPNDDGMENATPDNPITGTPPADFDLSGFEEFMKSVNFSVGGGGGGGAGFSAPPVTVIPELAKKFEEMQDSEAPQLDGEYNKNLDDIQQQIAALQGKLVDLDPETAAKLDQMRQAQLAQVEDTYADKQDDMLTRLFAGGVNQSTIAGDIGKRLIEQQALTEQQAIALANQRELDTQMDLTDDARAGLMSQAQIEQGQLGAALDEFGIETSSRHSDLDRFAGLLETQTNAQARLDAAAMSANATVSAAGASAGARRFSAMAGLYGDQLRLAENARQFDTSLGEDQRQFDLQQSFARERADADDYFRQLDSDRSYDLGRRNISSRVGIANADRQLRAAMYADQANWRGSQEERRRFESDRDFGLRKRGLDQGVYMQEQQADAQQDAAYMALFSSLIGAFSDVRLKDGLRTVGALDAVNELRGVEWNWKSDGEEGAGVIAQDVARVIPNAVFYKDGRLGVFYGRIIATLVEAVKELSAKVEELETA